MRRDGWLVIGLLLLALWGWSQRPAGDVVPGVQAPQATGAPAVGTPSRSPPPLTGTAGNHAYPAYLPREAHDTLQLIARGGPYPHRQDGATFQNRERRLPAQPRGYYREYTVRTPEARDRGARRIIAGGDPPVEFFYTDDHYRSFRHFPAAQGLR